MVDKKSVKSSHLILVFISLSVFANHILDLVRIPGSIFPKTEQFLAYNLSGNVNHVLDLEKELRIYDPQSQLHQIRDELKVLLVVSAVLFLLCFFKAMMGLTLRGVRSRRLEITSIFILLLFFSSLCLLMVHDGVDETYLFVTQIESFRRGDGNTIATLGEFSASEASADVFSIIVGGVLGILLPWIKSESLAIISGIFGGWAVIGYLARYLSYKMKIEFFFLVASTLTLFSPPFLGSISNGFPLSWTVLACLIGFRILGSEEEISILHRNLSLLLAFAIRPEIGLIILFLSLIQGVFLSLQSKRNLASTFRESAYLNFPAFILIAIWTISRIFLFGGWLPSGILGKDVGVKADFIDSGISYLRNLEVTTKGFSLILFLIIAFSMFKKSGFSPINYMVVVFPIVFLSTATLSGGDWFPVFWQRYTLPVTVAGALFLASKISEQGVDRRALVVTILAPLVLLQWSLASLAGGIGPIPPSRASCLSTLGIELNKLFPDKVGLGTPELNTVAFYADQPVLDLIGLASSNLARTPALPLSPGDVLHRKHDPNAVRSMKPGILYLFSDTLDGVDCGAGTLAKSIGPEMIDVANYFLSSNRVKYRAGDTVYLSRNYLPIFIGSKNGGPRFLIWIRNDLESYLKQSALNQGYDVSEVKSQA